MARLTEPVPVAQQPGKPCRSAEFPGQRALWAPSRRLADKDPRPTPYHSGPKPPFIPGHEGVGQVAAGPGVRGVKEGDRVGVPWQHTGCGACECCCEQGYGMLRPRGTMSLVGLPLGRFELPTVETVLQRITVR
ncbi:MAG: alcohol dehydrogenase catalytic domain-containing protein, partial [Deltaproteobacteria bacterium]|nr:alcohol dehydrogenase catalytic domain-containing protein [Deltaproteobacteria bacterium]